MISVGVVTTTINLQMFIYLHVIYKYEHNENTVGI